MLEIYLKRKDYPSCYSVLEVLRMQKKVLTNYIDQETVKIKFFIFLNQINTILVNVGKKEYISNYMRNSK